MDILIIKIMGMVFPLDSLIFQMVTCAFIPRGIYIYFSFTYIQITGIFKGSIEKLEGEISSFLTEMAFPPPFV